MLLVAVVLPAAVVLAVTPVFGIVMVLAVRGLRRRDLADDALQFVEAGELDDQLAPPPTHLDADAGLQLLREAGGDRCQFRWLGPPRARRARRPLVRTDRDDL